MFIGHYAPTFLIKKAEPKIPLWILFIAVQFTDIIWDLLILLGVEKANIVTSLPSNPLELYYMPFSHGLLSVLAYTLLICVILFFLPYFKERRKQIGWIGFAVFSHWILDLLVHRPDLPLLFNQFKIGFALWNYPLFALSLEIGLFIFGAIIYYNSILTKQRKGIALFVLFTVLAGIVQIGSAFSPPSSVYEVAIPALCFYLFSAAFMFKVEKNEPIKQAIS